MPTLAANLLSDAHAAAAPELWGSRTKRKNKSVTLGKGGPGSGPHAGAASREEADKASNAARAASKTANTSDKAADHKDAAAAHFKAAASQYSARDSVKGSKHESLGRMHERLAGLT